MAESESSRKVRWVETLSSPEWWLHNIVVAVVVVLLIVALVIALFVMCLRMLNAM